MPILMVKLLKQLMLEFKNTAPCLWLVASTQTHLGELPLFTSTSTVLTLSHGTLAAALAPSHLHELSF